MIKRILFVTILGMLVVGVVLAVISTTNDTTEQDTALNSATRISQNDPQPSQSAQSSENMNDALMSAYINVDTLNANPTSYAQTDKVYFFHASWCPICKSIDNEINQNIVKIPSGITIVKTDFDASTDLRKQFGVTTQYTFVRVDQNGQQIAKWTSTTFDKVLEELSTQ